MSKYIYYNKYYLTNCILEKEKTFVLVFIGRRLIRKVAFFSLANFWNLKNFMNLPKKEVKIYFKTFDYGYKNINIFF